MAQSPLTVSIVIPARNEDESIVATLTAIDQAFASTDYLLDVVVVNDGSTDQTGQVVREFARNRFGFRCVDNPGPNGFGYAIRKGLKHMQGDLVLIVMADGSDHPDDMLAYVKKIHEGYDCCFGSRWSQPNLVKNYPPFKKVINRLANHMIRFGFCVPYDDMTNAFKAYRTEVIQALRPIRSCHFDITVELPLKAIIKGYSYAVVPTRWEQRSYGESKLKLWKMVRLYVRALFPLFWSRLFTRSFNKPINSNYRT